MSNILITLCARGGSKGVPKKNIKSLCGKPMIQYSIDVATEFIESTPHNTKIALSTDDSEIIKVANQLCINTDYVRPEHLASDTSGKIDVIKHLLHYEESLNHTKYDFIIDLDVSSPLRNNTDLREAFDELISDDDAFNIFSVSKAHRNPYFNMVERNSSGYYSLIKQLPTNILSRQKAPAVYDLNASFYIYRRSFFEQDFKTVITPKTKIYNVNHVCFDIDTMIDFDIMEFLISQDKLGFEL